MNKEFIPYEQALELNELGFNELCLGFYKEDGKFKVGGYYQVSEKVPNGFADAPLYQQAFRWFREKYDLDSYIFCTYVGILYEHSTYTFSIQELYRPNYFIDQDTYTYQEAEFECLKKLIEIVKNAK